MSPAGSPRGAGGGSQFETPTHADSWSAPFYAFIDLHNSIVTSTAAACDGNVVVGPASNGFNSSHAMMWTADSAKSQVDPPSALPATERVRGPNGNSSIAIGALSACSITSWILPIPHVLFRRIDYYRTRQAWYFVSMRQTFFALLFACSLAAQTKLPPTPADYGQWETLVEGGGGGRGGGGVGVTGLSPDGKWLTYGINRANGNNELRVTNLASNTTKTTAFGSQPAYSADSKWLAFSIGYSESESDRMRAANRPVHNKLALMNLATGDQTMIDDIESFSFSSPCPK